MKLILTRMNKMLKIMTKQSIKQCNQAKVFLCTKDVSNSTNDGVRTYSLEETTTILKVLNEETPEGLSNYKISKLHALVLKENRDKNGEYRSLNESALLQIINYNALNEFYTSIVNSKLKGIKSKQRKGYPIIPRLSEEKRQKINSVLGIHIGTNAVSWTVLNRNNEVLDWSCMSFFDVKPSDTLSLLKIALRVNSKLSTYDVYVMEETKSNFNVVPPLQLQKQQLTAMILTCIAHKNEINGTLATDDIFFLRNQVIAQRYKLRIGTEIISTTQVVDNILRSSVFMDESIKAAYRHKSTEHKEQMHWSLLIGVCFLELAAHQEYSYKKSM